MQRGCIGSLDMLGYEIGGNEIADLLARDGSVLSLQDLNWPWVSLGRKYEEGLDVGWLTSIGYGGEVLATPKERLES